MILAVGTSADAVDEHLARVGLKVKWSLYYWRWRHKGAIQDIELRQYRLHVGLRLIKPSPWKSIGARPDSSGSSSTTSSARLVGWQHSGAYRGLAALRSVEDRFVYPHAVLEANRKAELMP